MAKVNFSRIDVMNITRRVSAKLAALREAPYGSDLAISLLTPSSPITEKLMREIGISEEKMSEAYRIAREKVLKSK